MNFLKQLGKKWLKRYGPPEIFASIWTLGLGLIADWIWHNSFVTAIAGTLGDAIGYYGTIVYNDLKATKAEHKKITFPLALKTLRHILYEFGVAEILDDFFVRPLCLYLGPKLLNDVGLGLLVGKIVADIIFYLPVFISVKLRKALHLN